MAKAIYYQKGEAIDYRPTTAVAAGEIVVQGKLVGITRLDIPAGTLGSLAVTGVFKVAKASAAVFATGAEVFYNGTAAVASGDNKLGLAVAPAAAGDEYVLVLLNA
jgi:predicted RecA/RadA family phage recombinase